MLYTILIANVCVLSMASAILQPSGKPSKDSKPRQYIQPLAGPVQSRRNFALTAHSAAPAMAVAAAPAASVALQPAAIPPPGLCPGGSPLPIECDPKRPWPQCPPHSYCYATNSVDVGPYHCCPVWSTYGAKWRPTAPFFNHVPPIPQNWPDVMKMTASWPSAATFLPFKARKPASNEEGKNEKSRIGSFISKWMEKQLNV